MGHLYADRKGLRVSTHFVLWSTIASQLSGRTDNEMKNNWNTHLKKRLLGMGLDPSTHAPKTEIPIRNGLQGSHFTTLLRRVIFPIGQGEIFNREYHQKLRYSLLLVLGDICRAHIF
ncbi:transcription factor MYB17-like isoform X2 [Cryptomeria japonica]|uniref:transcription factor MYB17-like isoform X2 n=1 Tax=Cryptomeria japonica TaxID=3369 RepID=UPI0027DAA5A3|nr:transcription factor MYB17-like isoform X2 [Cryptomeria japonica]